MRQKCQITKKVHKKSKVEAQNTETQIHKFKKFKNFNGFFIFKDAKTKTSDISARYAPILTMLVSKFAESNAEKIDV